MEKARRYVARLVDYFAEPERAKVQLCVCSRILSLSMSLVSSDQVECNCIDHKTLDFNHKLDRKLALRSKERGNNLLIIDRISLSKDANMPEQAKLVSLPPNESADSELEDGQQEKRIDLALLADRISTAMRVFTTLWMIYVIVRHNLIDYIGSFVGLFIHLNMPIRCYLPGSYIISEEMNEITAAMLSGAHLSWRSFHCLHKPYVLSVVQFMLISEDDLATFYASLDWNDAIELSIKDSERLCEKQRYMLNIMCYKISLKTRVIYRLRHNRSMGTRQIFYRTIAKLTLTSLVGFAAIAAVLVSTFTFMIFLDSRYLRIYKNCNPELQRRQAELPWYSVTVTPHRLYAGIIDGAENLTLWLEGGLICFFGPCFTAVVNYDLILCWAGIEKKIELLSSLISQDSMHRTVTMSRYSIIGKPAKVKGKIHELLVEIVDFFDQVKRADTFVSDYLSAIIIGWLILCAIYTYVTQINFIKELPINIAILMTFFVTLISIPCFGMLELYKKCMDSYSKLCSMMTHDQTKHEHNYGVIIDMYNRKRCCYTVMGKIKFVPNTFLTVIGWTCSCFCLISGVLRDRVRFSRERHIM